MKTTFMKKIETSTINDLQEKLSSCIDNELDKVELELLIDKLLENSSQAEALRTEWQTMHLVSNSSFNDANSESTITSLATNEFPLIDVSVEISRKIENEEQTFPFLPEQKLSEQVLSGKEFSEQKLIKPEITVIPDSFRFFKKLVAGSAIAASVFMLVVNVINTEPGFLDKTPATMAQNNQLEQLPIMLSSRGLEKNNIKVDKDTALTKNKSVLVTNNSVANHKLYKLPRKDTNINYLKTPMDNKKYSTLIHKVSLKQK
jgi:negative regulator of sigma E activity